MLAPAIARPRGLRVMSRLPAVILATMLLAPPAQGQLLPSQLPSLPAGVPKQLPQVGGPVSPRVADLRAARQLRIRDLIRTHREVVEADARGEPVVRGEVLAMGLGPEALARAQAEGFTVVRSSDLEGVGITVVTLAAPSGMSAVRAVRTLRRLDPQGVYDFNHIYTGAGEAPVPVIAAPVGAQTAAPIGAAPADMARIGLIDGGVDTSHPAFASALTERWGCDGRLVPSAHGTAVASLMIGETADFAGVFPSAALYAADVYCDAPTGGNALALAAAFSWLAAQDVPVINVSLVGPPNAALERVISRLMGTGRLVIAAVGNDGPSAPPLYPAAYPGVIGVTGVDANRRVLVEACRGPQVAFAAPGAEVAAAAGADSFASVRGTSFAAPIVAAMLALELRDGRDGAAGARAALAGKAIDLGKRGRDDTYGAGLVGDRFRTDPARLAAGESKGL